MNDKYTIFLNWQLDPPPPEQTKKGPVQFDILYHYQSGLIPDLRCNLTSAKVMSPALKGFCDGLVAWPLSLSCSRRPWQHDSSRLRSPVMARALCLAVCLALFTICKYTIYLTFYIHTIYTSSLKHCHWQSDCTYEYEYVYNQCTLL